MVEGDGSQVADGMALSVVPLNGAKQIAGGQGRAEHVLRRGGRDAHRVAVAHREVKGRVPPVLNTGWFPVRRTDVVDVLSYGQGHAVQGGQVVRRGGGVETELITPARSRLGNDRCDGIGHAAVVKSAGNQRAYRRRRPRVGDEPFEAETAAGGQGRGEYGSGLAHRRGGLGGQPGGG